MNAISQAVSLFTDKRWLSTPLFDLLQLRSYCSQQQYDTVVFHRRELDDILLSLQNARHRFTGISQTSCTTIQRSDDTFVLRIAITPCEVPRLIIVTSHGLCILRFSRTVELEAIHAQLKMIQDLSTIERYCNMNVLDFVPDAL